MSVDETCKQTANVPKHISDRIDVKSCAERCHGVVKQSFTGWKKIVCGVHPFYFGPKVDGKCIVELLIPKDAQVVLDKDPNGKNRASKARVVKIKKNVHDYTSDEFKWKWGIIGRCESFHNSRFRYKVNKVVEPECTFDPNVYDDCASGIHFFMDRESAENY